MHEQHFTQVKMALGAVLAFLTAVLGWYGWLCLLLALCMALDYITGTAAAKKTGTWSSKVARDGLWHKVAIVAGVAAASILDIVLGLILNNIPVLELPFTYSVAFGPVVVVWYMLTELGSILENSGELGGPQPAWFKKAIAALKDQVDDSMGGGQGDENDSHIDSIKRSKK